MGWFCTHLSTKTLKFVKTFKKMPKNGFFETFFKFSSKDRNTVVPKGIW